MAAPSFNPGERPASSSNDSKSQSPSFLSLFLHTPIKRLLVGNLEAIRTLLKHKTTEADQRATPCSTGLRTPDGETLGQKGLPSTHPSIHRRTGPLRAADLHSHHSRSLAESQLSARLLMVRQIWDLCQRRRKENSTGPSVSLTVPGEHTNQDFSGSEIKVFSLWTVLLLALASGPYKSCLFSNWYLGILHS